MLHLEGISWRAKTVRACMRRVGFLILCWVAVQSALADDTNLMLTVGGITYSNVTFGAVTPSWVSIRHSTGAASIPLGELPPELQKKFGYDPQKGAPSRVAEQESRQIGRAHV